MFLKIKPYQIDEWVKLYVDGYTYSEIARIYNVSRYTISKYLKPMNLEHSKQHTKIPQNISMKMVNEWIEHCKNKTMSSEEISRTYNVTRNTVTKYVSMFGYKFTKNIAHRQVYNTMICLYDKYDTLVYCFENAYEMSKKLNRSYGGIQSIISKCRHGKNKGKTIIKGVKYRIELIEKEKDDETDK